MLIVVCGLIGSGKSTYVEKIKGESDFVSDFDINGFDKTLQIQESWEKLNEGKTVYHITCMPTIEEMEFFNCISDIKYLWVNTSPSQCIENIKKRNRKRDMINTQGVINTNKNKLVQYRYSTLPFEVINLFDSNEKW